MNRRAVCVRTCTHRHAPKNYLTTRKRPTPWVATARAQTLHLWADIKRSAHPARPPHGGQLVFDRHSKSRPSAAVNPHYGRTCAPWPTLGTQQYRPRAPPPKEVQGREKSSRGHHRAGPAQLAGQRASPTANDPITAAPTGTVERESGQSHSIPPTHPTAGHHSGSHYLPKRMKTFSWKDQALTYQRSWPPSARSPSWCTRPGNWDLAWQPSRSDEWPTRSLLGHWRRSPSWTRPRQNRAESRWLSSSKPSRGVGRNGAGWG